MNSQTIAEAIYVINRHAKTTTDTERFYKLKRAALLKLLRENSAYVVGLQYHASRLSTTPRKYVLICCHNYFFHLVPTEYDLSSLPNVVRNNYQRNRRVEISLETAIQIISSYLRSNNNRAIRRF
jgi:hypothetical protein